MAETTVNSPRKYTFDDVWAALMEDREQMRKSKEEFDERMRETDKRQREISEQMKKTDEELEKTGRYIKKIGKQIGGLNNSFGKLAEHLVAPGIAKRFNEMGYHFDTIAAGGLKILGEDGKTKTEIDLLLENDKFIIALEVKAKPLVKDIPHHQRRLEILREDRAKEHNYKKILGAIFGSQEKKAVLEAGMYVLEQSGDTMRIEAPDGPPHEW
jgi:septal ring factor EnvC (AmiA/AmiB activator)